MYVWTVENVWAILKQDLDKLEVNDVQSLRREIKRSWCQISQDKGLQETYKLYTKETTGSS